MSNHNTVANAGKAGHRELFPGLGQHLPTVSGMVVGQEQLPGACLSGNASRLLCQQVVARFALLAVYQTRFAEKAVCSPGRLCQCVADGAVAGIGKDFVLGTQTHGIALHQVRHPEKGEFHRPQPIFPSCLICVLNSSRISLEL